MCGGKAVKKPKTLSSVKNKKRSHKPKLVNFTHELLASLENGFTCITLTDLVETDCIREKKLKRRRDEHSIWSA